MKEFGTTDGGSERDDETVAHVRDLTGGYGVYSVLKAESLFTGLLTMDGTAGLGGSPARSMIVIETCPQLLTVCVDWESRNEATFYAVDFTGCPADNCLLTNFGNCAGYDN